MVGVGHVGEDTGMDMRVKGLDAAIKAFRETSDFGDLGHFDTQLSQTLRGGTGGNHSVPALMNASASTSMPSLWKTDTRARRIGRFVVVTLILLVIVVRGDRAKRTCFLTAVFRGFGSGLPLSTFAYTLHHPAYGENMLTATKVSSHAENKPMAVGCPTLRVDAITSTPTCARCFDPKPPFPKANSKLEATDTTALVIEKQQSDSKTQHNAFDVDVPS